MFVEIGSLHSCHTGVQCYRSNLTGTPDDRVAHCPFITEERRHINASTVELLARDENDFAEDVPLIPWEEFLAHARDMHRDAPKEIPK